VEAAMQPSEVLVGNDLEQIYREIGDRLWWAVLAYAGDRDVASDAVAEAFAQALRRGSAVRSPRAWVWKAAFRIAAGELQRRRRATGEVPEASYDLPSVNEPVFDALPQLSTNQRAAIVLHYYADKPIAEVAKIMGCSPATVAVHLHRGRARLRELLGEDVDA
jgi:RNA polymerase sigma-70 factor (ECF subfamily)